jgi:4-oxalomesaconate hydratase
MVDEMRKRAEVPSAEELTRLMGERADVKSKEILHACSILGVKEQDVYFLGADDAVLLVTEPMVRSVARLIRKLRPDVLITHFPLEDAGIATAHATCGQIVMHAIQLAAGVDPGDRTPPHHVTQVFYFGIGAAAARVHLWSAQGGFYNDVLVDITDVAEKKVACLDAIASQSYAGAYARKRIEASDGAFGNRMRFPYAEGFISLYSTGHYYLPVSEIDRERARTTDHDNLGRSSFRVNVP